jgi:hypothetical protein
MAFLPPAAYFALLASALLVLTLLGWRLRQRQQLRQQLRRGAAPEPVDTVAGWAPQQVRVLTVTEREAYDLLRRALPGFLVLAQVPLSRFIRVPARRSYTEWLQRVGSLSADLLLCDSGSRVLAVIDIRSAHESERGHKRHERMGRVLRAAGIQVHVWREGELPAVGEMRLAFANVLGPAAAGTKPTASRPMPLIPVPEMAELLAEGDRAALDATLDGSMEPVPSAFFEDFETPARAR